jgi:Uma2 family endonuclease
MVQTPIKQPTQQLTLDAFLAMPETKPASEFIDQRIIQKPMPQGKHSTVQGDFVSAVNTVLKPSRIARAYPELRCTFGVRSIVPDVVVFKWDRIPRDVDGRVANAFKLAPDWTIEILSPDQSQTKVVRNILHCLENGTEMGWLIDPEERVVFVYFADRKVAIFEQPAAQIPVPSFAVAFELTVGELFGWLDA